MMRPHAGAALAGLLLLGCAAPPPGPPATPALMGAEIETAADGRCYGRDITPAVIETLVAQELDRPEVRAADGTLISPAAYRTVTRQAITRERGEVLFETLCPPAYTADLVATLQRALAARGFYRGPITAALDQATGRAIQDFQRQDGPDSPLMSLRTARTLGIVALSPDQVDRL